jgi:hypothetical protein
MRKHIRKSRSNLLRLEGITSLIVSEAEMEADAGHELRQALRRTPLAT